MPAFFSFLRFSIPHLSLSPTLPAPISPHDTINPSLPLPLPLPLSPMANISLTLLFLTAAAGVLFLLADAASIHDLLIEHGLPAGLLPKAVDSYALNRSTGLLEVRLDRPCYAKYDDGLAFFDRAVQGNLSYGALRSVVGLKQEELFLWLPVRGILVDNPSSGVILFDIGVARKQLSLSLFEVPPDCRPEASLPLPAAAAAVIKGEEDIKMPALLDLGFSLASPPFVISSVILGLQPCRAFIDPTELQLWGFVI